MNIPGRSKKRVWLIVPGLLIAASIVSAVVLSARRQSVQQPQQAKTKHPKEWLTSIPSVGSKVKNLQIINPHIVRQDTDLPAVAFDVWNNSNRAVMAIRISCGEGHISKDGLEDDENPIVIIEPYGSLPAEMSDELTPGQPIIVTAAVFDDRKGEGEKSSLDFLERVRLRQRKVLKSKRAQSQSSPETRQ